MVRKYETAVVFDGSLPEETVAAEQKAVEEFIAGKFEFHNTEVWGKRDLAYEINKKRSGYYCLFIYSGEGNMNDIMTEYFKLNAKVIRHMTVIFEALKEKKVIIEREDDSDSDDIDEED